MSDLLNFLKILGFTLGILLLLASAVGLIVLLCFAFLYCPWFVSLPLFLFVVAILASFGIYCETDRGRKW